MAILGNYDTETNQRVLTSNLDMNQALHGSIEGLVKVVVMKINRKLFACISIRCKICCNKIQFRNISHDHLLKH